MTLRLHYAISCNRIIISQRITAIVKRNIMSVRASAQAVLQIRAKMGRLKRGLYGGKEVRFGNHVSFSSKKTRRRWNPNVQKKKIYSELLDKDIKIPVTTSVLRTIEKYNGFDNYILKYPVRKFKAHGSEIALSLRAQMQEKLKTQQQEE